MIIKNHGKKPYTPNIEQGGKEATEWLDHLLCKMGHKSFDKNALR